MLWRRKETAVYAEAYGCNQPQAFGHNERRRFPYMCWACATFPSTTHGTEKKEDACRMHVVECLPLLAPTCLGIYCPLFQTSFSTVVKSMPFMQLQIVLVHGVLALRCACARGNGAQVCMCRGQRPPSVHVQWNTAETLKPESP